MPFAPFVIGNVPQILFGAGRIGELPEVASRFGRRLLLVTGARSFRTSTRWPTLCAGLVARGVAWEESVVAGEPSPELVDREVQRFHGRGIEVVVAIGGGSVLDAAKAIAALLPFGNSVMDHLEDVGRGLPYRGPSLPLIAVPTTAGTGSEATKNAVLSVTGGEGYKKSFRHDTMVPKVALVDPELLAATPHGLMAAQGMDAFTQLLESFLSARANPFTDALALSGLKAFRDGFFAALEGSPEGRKRLSYSALLSGITLAQVGLGSVHGLAQPLGSYFAVPHGVACGTMVAEATATNIGALEERGGMEYLAKYAHAGRLLIGQPGLSDGDGRGALVELLRGWTDRLALPRLGHFGVTSADLPRIVAASRNNSMKSNPILLTDQEIATLVAARL